MHSRVPTGGREAGTVRRVSSHHSDRAEAARILERFRVWAVVGLSPDPARPSHRVARFLQDRGYEIVPVYPRGGTILGEPTYPDVSSIPSSRGVEVVDIFRRSHHAGRHVDEAIAMGAAAVWLQLGVVDGAAVERARASGLLAVMDRCPAIEYPRVFRA